MLLMILLGVSYLLIKTQSVKDLSIKIACYITSSSNQSQFVPFYCFIIFKLIWPFIIRVGDRVRVIHKSTNFDLIMTKYISEWLAVSVPYTVTYLQNTWVYSLMWQVFPTQKGWQKQHFYCYCYRLINVSRQLVMFVGKYIFPEK